MKRFIFHRLIAYAFVRPLSDSTSVARVRLTKELANLPCVIFHNSSSTCEHPIRKPAVSTIPVCLRVGSCLLDGTENEVTAEVRRLVYEALRRSIRHHTTGFGGRRVNHASEFISRGLKDQDRSVRLSAGSAFPLLCHLCVANSENAADLSLS